MSMGVLGAESTIEEKVASVERHMEELTDGFLELLKTAPNLLSMPEWERYFVKSAITFGYAGAIVDVIRSETCRKAALDRASAN